MSRVGKQIIKIPAGVEIKEDNGTVSVKGPLGTLTRKFYHTVKVVVEVDTVTAQPVRQSNDLRALWGTTGAHLRNMIEGVTKGFSKQLILEGVGYKVALAGDTLTFDLGFSHQVKVKVPAGIKVVVEKGNITISGFDKDLVGQFSAEIFDLKPVEPYKGKGMRFAGQFVRRKQGKKTAA